MIAARNLRGRLLVISPELTIHDPSSRIRGYSIAEKLRALRDVEVLTIQRGRNATLQRLRKSIELFKIAKNSDDGVTLYLQKGASSFIRMALLITWQRITASKMIFDFDDAVFTVSPLMTRLACRSADAVFVANEYLASYARRHCSTVLIIPTGIDLQLYRRSQTNSRSDVPVVGWIGTASNLEFLHMLEKPLSILARSNDFVFKLITDEMKARSVGWDSSIPLEVVDWNLGSFLGHLSTFDVGVCPLPENSWTRGKSGYKVLEYMAMGIPPVASPVGGLVSAIRNGIDGLLARTTTEWYLDLKYLLDDPTARDRIGRAAMSTVAERYSMDVVAARVANAIRNVEG